MQVNFLCVGAQKAGTTALHNTLQQHPDIYLPVVKEIYYFSSDRLYRKGPAYYHRFFKSVQTEQAIGEVTPDYLCHAEAPARIAAYNPEMKLIVMLRDPVDRAYSQYLMKKRNGREQRDFSACIRQELQMLQDKPPGVNLYSYVARGLYALQLNRYLACFPADQVHIILFDDFVVDQQAVVQALFSFLGVDPDVPIDYNVRTNAFFVPRFMLLQKMYNAIPNRVKRRFIDKVPAAAKARYHRLTRTRAAKEPMDEQTGSMLADYYRNELTALEQLLQRDLAKWRRL